MKKYLFVLGLVVLASQSLFAKVEKYRVIGRNTEWLGEISEVTITLENEQYSIDFFDDRGISMTKYESVISRTLIDEEIHVVPSLPCGRIATRACDNQADLTVKVHTLTRIFKIRSVLYGIPESWISIKESGSGEYSILEFGTTKARAILTLQKI